ncbi:hypothetical protein RRG08_059222 [Elysia crispata]|uniref:Sulfotransferase n=1 Tax=Elysia crispata TaxID=231223 RepID=A0AAE1DFE8_9GAST|nr:hypothetical protein RRG08_059222 [Elysia crispata]
MFAKSDYAAYRWVGGVYANDVGQSKNITSYPSLGPVSLSCEAEKYRYVLGERARMFAKSDYAAYRWVGGVYANDVGCKDSHRSVQMDTSYRCWCRHSTKIKWLHSRRPEASARFLTVESPHPWPRGSRQPVQHIYYLKIHKTGSSTIFAILAEYCRTHGLLPLLPVHSHINQQTPLLPEQQLMLSPKIQQYDMVFNHHVYDPAILTYLHDDVFRRALNWFTQDVIFFVKNALPESQTVLANMTDWHRERHKMFSQPDIQLYQHFLSVFKHRMSQTRGLQEETAELKVILKKLRKRVVPFDGVNSPRSALSPVLGKLDDELGNQGSLCPETMPTEFVL